MIRKDTVVLANDVSEGPDFAALRDYRIFTIYHVDVVAYVADIYFRGLVRPETTVKWYRRLHWALPSISKLVWEKQEASVLHSKGLIMPSEGMKEVLLRCVSGVSGGQDACAALGRFRSFLCRRRGAAAG